MTLLRLFRVRGESMQPLLQDGDLVFASSLPFLLRKPHPGDIIVAFHPFFRSTLIIKRITSVLPATAGLRIFVEGDNELASEDSHSYGSLAKHSLIGKVLYVSRNTRNAA